MRPTKAEQAVTSAAYLLFYKRRTESALGGNTSKLVAELLAKQQSEESDTTTPSPKPENDRSESSSPIPTVKPFISGGTIDPRNIESIYAPLLNREAPISSWGGGWSNRVGAASMGTGFHFGTGIIQDSAPVVDSQNSTQDDVDTNDDGEIEVVGMDGVEDSQDEEVQIIRLEPMDGDQTT